MVVAARRGAALVVAVVGTTVLVCRVVKATVVISVSMAIVVAALAMVVRSVRLLFLVATPRVVVVAWRLWLWLVDCGGLYRRRRSHRRRRVLSPMAVEHPEERRWRASESAHVHDVLVVGVVGELRLDRLLGWIDQGLWDFWVPTFGELRLSDLGRLPVSLNN